MSWASFAARRLLVALALLFALASVTFWVNEAIPYDAGYYLLRNVNNPTREQVQQANERLGVDRPALEQYGSFLGGVARGDLGISWQTATWSATEEKVVGEPVAPMVLRAAAVTGSLVLGGIVLLLAFALPVGPYLAARAGSATDRSVLLISLAFVSTHPLVSGLLLQLVLGRELGWLPDSGYCPFFSSTLDASADIPTTCGGPLDWATHLVLPWLAFALLFLALYLRQIRTQSLGVLQEPYVTVARAKGASERRVLLHHVVPSVVVVTATMVAMDVGTALGLALFVEVVYGLPGLGRLLLVSLQGFSGFDRPVIVAIVVVSGAAVVVVNLVADLVAAVADPRVRAAGGRAGRLGSDSL